MSHMISTDGWDLLWIPTLPPIIPTRQAATNPSAPEASEGKAANPRSNEEPVPAGEDPAPKERDPHNAALIDALKAFFVKFTKGEDPAPKEIDSHDPAVLDILKACSVGINEGGDPAPKGTGFFHDPGILNVLTACFVRFNCLSPGMAAIIYQYFTQGLGPDIDWTVLDHEKCGEVREWATQMGESLLYIEHPESPLNRFVTSAVEKHDGLAYIHNVMWWPARCGGYVSHEDWRNAFDKAHAARKRWSNAINSELNHVKSVTAVRLSRKVRDGPRYPIIDDERTQLGVLAREVNKAGDLKIVNEDGTSVSQYQALERAKIKPYYRELSHAERSRFWSKLLDEDIILNMWSYAARRFDLITWFRDKVYHEYFETAFIFLCEKTYEHFVQLQQQERTMPDYKQPEQPESRPEGYAKVWEDYVWLLYDLELCPEEVEEEEDTEGSDTEGSDTEGSDTEGSDTMQESSEDEDSKARRKSKKKKRNKDAKEKKKKNKKKKR